MAETRQVQVSVIVPVYNAETFIATAVRRLLGYLASMPVATELIIVDDGSHDGTPALLEAAAAEAPIAVVVVRNQTNQGKGAAVLRGMQMARGEQRLFLDADLAYPPRQIDGICAALSRGAAVAIACRVHPQSRYVIRPSFFPYLYTRHVAGRLFNRLVRWLLLPGILDSQAGLKGFSAAAAQRLFTAPLPHGFSFDLAVLFRARRLGLTVEQVPVLYRYDSEPTTVRFLVDTLLVLIDLVRIRLRPWDAGDAWPRLVTGPAPSHAGKRLADALTSAAAPSVLLGSVVLAIVILYMSRVVLPQGAVAAVAWLGSLLGFALLAARADLGQRRRPLHCRVHRGGWFFLLAIVPAAIAVRLVGLDHIPPMIHNDTAECGLLGLEILHGHAPDVFDFSPWYFTPYLSFVPYAASFALWGHTITALRLPSAVLGIAMLFPLYSLVRGWFGGRAALVATTLFALSHAAVHFSRIGLWNVQALFYAVTAFALLHAGLRRRSALAMAAAGMVSGLALYSYTAGRIVVVVAMLFLAVRVAQRGWIRAGHYALYYTAALVLAALPLVLNYVKDPHVIEFDRTASVWVLADINRPHVEGTLGVTSTGAVMREQIRRTLAGFINLGDASGQYGTAQPLLSPLTALFSAGGLLLILRRIREPRCLFLLLWSLLGLILGSVLIIDPPSFTRLIVLLPVPYVLAAVALEALWRRAAAPPFHLPRVAALAAVLLFVAQSALFNLTGYYRFVQEMSTMSREWDVVKVFERLRGDYDYYLFTGPFLLADSSIFRLFSSHSRVVNGFTEADVPERLARNAAFILSPEFRRIGMIVSQRFPAVERDVMTEDETAQLVIYRCTIENGCRRGTTS